jgi:hypothetical protein
VRSAAGAARDGERRDAKRVSDEGDVGNDVGDRSTRLACRLPIPWSVQREPAQAVAGIDGGVFPAADPPARRPVQGDEAQPGRVAPLSDGQGAPIRCREAVLDMLWNHPVTLTRSRSRRRQAGTSSRCPPGHSRRARPMRRGSSSQRGRDRVRSRPGISDETSLMRHAQRGVVAPHMGTSSRSRPRTDVRRCIYDP